MGLLKRKGILLIVFLFGVLCYAQTPGGVSSTGLDLWLKGDTGVSDLGTLTWSDQSGSGNNSVQSTATSKPAQSNLFNYNQTFTFDGDDYLAIQNLNYTNGSTVSDVYAFVVYATTFSGGNNDNWAFIDFDRSEAYNFYIEGNGRLAMSYKSLDPSTSDPLIVDNDASTTGTNTGIPHMGTFIFDNALTNESQIKLNGKSDYSSDRVTDPISVTNNRYGFVGDGSEATGFDGAKNSFFYEGDIAEIILFEGGGTKSTDDMRKIESYLAIKYGITLDVGNTTYVNSTGASGTTIWDNTATYWNNIGGIINDTGSGLDQKIATSVGSELILSTINNYTLANNDVSRTSLTAGSSLLFGDNGETGYDVFDAMTSENILRTKWLFNETGTDTGSVFLAIPISFFPTGTSVDFIFSTDDTFDGTDTRVTPSSDGTYYYVQRNIADGDRMSFIVTDIKIAGISVTQFDLLLRADIDLTTTASSLDWTDGSFNNANGKQNTATSIPSTSDLMNFNPTLTFDGSDDFIYLQNKKYTAAETISNLYVFSVFQTDFVGTGGSGTLFDNWALLDFDRSEAYNMYIYGNGTLGFSYKTVGGIRDSFSNSLGNDNIPHIGEFIYDHTLDVATPGSNETIMKFDGTVEFDQNVTDQIITINNDRYGFIGDGSEATSENGGRNNIYYDGRVAEVIMADRSSFSASEVLRIESYLGIKYGITIDNSITNYVNSVDTVIWDNTTYWNGVAGLIKDDVNSDLDQRVAQSSSAQDIIIATDNDFIASNLDTGTRPTALTEGSSLIFGNNGSDKSILEFGSTTTLITNRKWLFKEVGTDSGNIHIAFPRSYVTTPVEITAVDMIVSTNDTFGDMDDVTVAMSGDNATFDESTFYSVQRNFVDGNRIAFVVTVAAEITNAPGSVSSGIQMWLRGNDVVSSNNVVTTANDASLNTNSATQPTNIQKPTDASLVNFNPTITFDGTNDYLAVQNLNYTSNGEVDKTYNWVIYSTADTNNRALFDFDEDNYFTTRVNADGSLGFVYTASNDSKFTVNSTTIGTNDGRPKLGAFIFDPSVEANDTKIRLNGVEDIASDETNLGIGASTDTSRFGLLAVESDASTFNGTKGSNYYNGSIAEIVHYEGTTLSATDINKIESYLAIKYGITLDSSVGKYVASDATGPSDGTTIWDNTTYWRNVAAIGQDDGSFLLQKQSTSTEAGSMVTISLAGTIAATNAEIMENFDDDLDFLAWGNDGSDDVPSLENTGLPVGICELYKKRLDRDWKVKNTGSVGTVTVQFDVTGLGDPVDFDLIVDNEGDGDFSAGVQDTYGSPTVNGSLITFTGVDLSDGYVFSLFTDKEVSDIIYVNGAWNGGAGTNGEFNNSATDLVKTVEVKGDVTLTGTHNCKCLTISNSAKVTVQDNNNLTISDRIDSNGSIFLYGNSELIQTRTGSDENLGIGQLYKIIGGGTSYVYNYNYFSSPVNTSGTYSISGNLKFNTDVLDIETNTNPSFTGDKDGSTNTISTRWTYTFPDGSAWNRINESSAIDPGLGFIMKGTGDANRYNFIGSPNNGVITRTITSGNIMLLGNPYPSSVNMDGFNSSMLGAGVTTGTIYLWDQPSAGSSHNTSDYDGGYATRAVGVGTPASGVSGANTPGNELKPGQGFFVQGGASGGNITFQNTMRISGTAAHFFKAKSDGLSIVRVGFEFETEDKKTYHRQLALSLRDGHSLGKDIGYDAMMLDYKANDMYWLLPGEGDVRYVINSVSSFIEDDEIALGVSVDKEREVVFKLDKLEHYSSSIYLYDKDYGSYTNLTKGEYRVTLAKGSYSGRFSIAFEVGETLGTDEIILEDISIKQDREVISISTELKDIKEVGLFNVNGKLLEIGKINVSGNVLIDKKNIPSGVYILRITTEQGTASKKFFVQ